jgi:hypothetical protein
VSVPREQRLGYFTRFMVAYGKADAQTRAAISQEVGMWRLGRETDQALVLDVSRLLNIVPPTVIT